MVDEELQDIRKRLLKINDKIKSYSNLSKSPQFSNEKEIKPQRLRGDQEIPVDEMRAKLRAINEYIRARAMGRDVKPPVFLREELPPPPVEKLAFVMEEETVEEVGEEQEPVPVKEEETTTVVLPALSRGRNAAVRTGVGLDLGTAYIVASREVEDKRVFVKNERNAFLSVRCDQSTKDLLTRLKIKYVALQDKLYVLGGMALELADIFGRETQRSMNMGILNPSEAESIPIIQLLVKNILWEPREKGEVCCFSVPAKPLDRDQDTIYHRGVFEGILKNIGFKPLVIDEGYAVVLSEMEDQDFTGIGISCGAGMVNICAAFKSVPVLSFSITRGGDWIDKSAATVLGVPTTRVSTIKEHGMSIKIPANREEEAIAIYYRNYIHYLIENMARVFGKSTDTPHFKEPADIVFAGGSSMVPGFIDVVQEEIKSVKFGFPVGNILHAKEPFTSVVRGCLFNAINGGSQ
ncbi:MAG: cell division FtsA domain-containing protein [Candidatus Omnitrophica bacterium]|nr:cell division FtsA domain-containing protein [Candidatus Omnitrophota bacterium]